MKKKEFIGDEKQRIEAEIEELNKIFKKYDELRDKVPQLDFLLSLSIITLDHKSTREFELEKDIENLDEVFFVLDSDSQNKITHDKLKHINMAQELFNAYYEFFSIHKGFEILDEAGTSEDDKEALESEIAWWSENIDYFIEDTEYDLTFLIFRAIRNNVLESLITGELNLIHRDWVNKITVI